MKRKKDFAHVAAIASWFRHAPTNQKEGPLTFFFIRLIIFFFDKILL